MSAGRAPTGRKAFGRGREAPEPGFSPENEEPQRGERSGSSAPSGLNGG